MSFALYVFGFLVITGGMIYGAFLLGVPQQWIAVGALVTLGFGVLTGAVATRQKDSAE